MKVENSNINFYHLIPTEAFLRSAAKIHNFEDAKLLNYSVNVKYSGWISFYKRAIKIAESIINKNPELQKTVTEIIQEENIEQKQVLIKNFVKLKGETIDVIL